MGCLSTALISLHTCRQTTELYIRGQGMTVIDSSNIIDKLIFATQRFAENAEFESLRSQLVSQANSDREQGVAAPSRNMVL